MGSLSLSLALSLLIYIYMYAVELVSHNANTHLPDLLLPLLIPIYHICIQYFSRTALNYAAESKHGKVVGVLIGAMAAGQDVNACLGSVISLSLSVWMLGHLCVCVWVRECCYRCM